MLQGVLQDREGSILGCACLGPLSYPQALNQYRVYCSVSCGQSYLQTGCFVPSSLANCFAPQGGKQKPRGISRNIVYLDSSLRPASFRTGSSFFIYLTSVVCSHVNHCSQALETVQRGKQEAGVWEYIVPEKNLYLSLTWKQNQTVVLEKCE